MHTDNKERNDYFGMGKSNRGAIDVEIAKASGYALVKYASKNMNVFDFTVCIKTDEDQVTRAWIENSNGVVTDQTYGEDGGEFHNSKSEFTKRKHGTNRR